MPIEHDYDSGTNLMQVLVTEVLTIREIAGYIQAVIDCDGVSREFIEIVDLGTTSEFRFSYSETRGLPALFRDLRERKGYAGSIVIAHDDLQYGIARMICSVIGESTPTDVVRSRDEVDEAVRRLREKAGSDSPGDPVSTV